MTRNLLRPIPRNLQAEPPFPGRHTVTFHICGSEFVMHRPVKKCRIKCPHTMAECGEFREKD